MNENKLITPRRYGFLRVMAVSVAVILVLQIMTPSIVSVIAESNPALARIYGMLGESAGEPETCEDYYELANIEIGKRNYEEALDHLEKARELVQKDDNAMAAELHLKSASVYVITEQSDKALKHLDEAIRLDENNAQARLLRAQLAIDRRDNKDAAADLKVYVELVPENTSMRLTLAQLQESNGDYAGAQVQYEALYEALQDESHRLNAHRCQFLAGEYEEALSAFEKIAQDKKIDEQYRSIAAFLKAACMMQMQRFDEAAEGFAQAQKLGYDEAACYDQMMICYFEAEAYEQTVEYGEKLTEMKAAAAETDVFQQRMGAAMVQLERYEEALTYLGRSMEINPDLTGNAYYRGVALLALKRYEEAAADFGKSIEQGFLTQFCYYNRGVCHVQMLDYEKAIDDMGMTLTSGEDETLIEAAKNILWQLAAYYESQETK